MATKSLTTKMEEKGMNFELTVRYNNADSGESEEQNISFEANDNDTKLLVAACRGDLNEESLGNLFKHLYDNPNMDASGTGVAYNKIWTQMSHFAFERLGWYDVTVDVFGLKIDDLVFEIDLGSIDISQWSLQLSREGYMYCYA
jgi:hypothetical protein